MNATAVQSSVYQLPHRKPLPPAALPVRLHPTRAMPTEPPQSPVAQPLAPSTSGHNRSRLSTSSTFSSMTVAQSNARGPPNTNPVSYQAYMNQHNPTARRSLSNATASTSSTGGGGPVRQNSASSSNLQRTTSSRSGTSATSYVALMRRQKATVWCDRAQQEDPRLLAQQRAAKVRAAIEVSGAAATRNSTSSSSLSGGVRSKIRHHGAPKAQQYAPAPHMTTGVPMRLSANEVDEEESDEENHGSTSHQRTDSGRSSLGSARRMSTMYGQTQPDRASAASSLHNTTPPSGYQLQGHGLQTSHARHERTVSQETPTPHGYGGPDYFVVRPQTGGVSTGSNGSNESERENSFGNIGSLPQRLKVPDEEAKKLDLVDLRRRGSVDERTSTMSGYGRLFVANPDMDD